MLIGNDIETRVIFKNALLKLGKTSNLGDYFRLDKALAATRDRYAHPPKIIFLEVGSDLAECTEQLRLIRATTLLKNAPVVVYDANSRLDETHTIFCEGADAFIHQPYDYQRLRKVIGNIFNTDWDNVQRKCF